MSDYDDIPDPGPPTAESNALVTEHCKWTPLTLVDDVVDTFTQLLYEALNGVENFLHSQSTQLGYVPPPGTIADTDGAGNIVLSPEHDTEISRGMHKLETLFEAAVDRCLDGFELFVIRNVLKVEPALVPWVRLRHQEGFVFREAEGTEVLGARLRESRRKLAAGWALGKKLAAQKRANEETLRQLRALVAASESEPVSADEEIPTNPFALLANAGEVRTAATFGVIQVRGIQEVLREVKGKYEALCQAMEEEGDAGEARRLYIEKITRKHIEAGRKVRLNEKGEVVGSDYEAEGERRTGEEVERLEEVVEGLRKN